MKPNHFPRIHSSGLHVLAMVFMLLDHSWATILPSQVWMTCVGRIAFPVFAFMTVEGFFHTRNFKRYLLRMTAFAVLSEIPFDLMYGGTAFYPYHQNVLWTFLISLLCIFLLEKVRCFRKRWLIVSASAGIVLTGFLSATVLMTDYYGTGVLTVLVFYYFRKRNIWCFAAQFALLYWLNVEVLGGLYYPVTIFGIDLEIVQQGIALLALIPIWMYDGQKGYSAKWFQYFCYAFYPSHCLLLSVVAMIGL